VAGQWELAAVGEVTAPTAVLVRPDGHVALVGEGTESGLAEVVGSWFGTPSGSLVGAGPTGAQGIPVPGVGSRSARS
jgi:hypothetical protein